MANEKKQQKKSSESLENCTTSGAKILKAHFFVIGFFIEICKKREKKSLKHPTKRKGSSVTPILKPLGQGSSLATLWTTFDTWLPPDPLKPPLAAHSNPLILEMSVRHQV